LQRPEESSIKINGQVTLRISDWGFIYECNAGINTSLKTAAVLAAHQSITPSTPRMSLLQLTPKSLKYPNAHPTQAVVQA